MNITHALVLLFLLLSATGFSQTLLEDTQLKISVGERGGEVLVLSARECSRCFYYLPLTYSISAKRGSKVPEISLVTWKDDKAQVTEGGILHFLLEWGLSANDEKAILTQLREQRDSLAVLMGPATIDIQSTPVISGDDNLATTLREALTNIPSGPTTPGSKAAYSFKFSEKQVATFLYYKKYPTKTKTKLQGNYSYEVETKSGQVITRDLSVTLCFSEILTLTK